MYYLCIGALALFVIIYMLVREHQYRQERRRRVSALLKRWDEMIEQHARYVAPREELSVPERLSVDLERWYEQMEEIEDIQEFNMQIAVHKKQER